MRGALLPQMLELWQISKTQFGILMSIYGMVHNVFYLALAWVQDRFASRILIPVNMVLGGVTTFFLGTTTDFIWLCLSVRHAVFMVRGRVLARNFIGRAAFNQ